MLGKLSAVLLIAAFGSIDAATYYDTFTQKVITAEEHATRVKNGLTFCSIEVADCDPTEFRRLDGSCTNLAHPAAGAPYTPLIRILPANFSTEDNPRKAKSGKELPLSRHVVTSLLAMGRAPSDHITMLLMSYFLLMSVDPVIPLELTDAFFGTPYCCTARAKEFSNCAANPIPFDDPIHRYSGERCINMTKPITFQSQKCASSSKSSPTRANNATPLMDLNPLYGSSDAAARAVRALKGGLLKYETENNKIWPPSLPPAYAAQSCLANQPGETRCHNTPLVTINALLPSNVMAVWLWRLHNFFANGVAAVNPCWDDERLFYTARDLLIATYTNIFYYELLPILMGRKNMEKSGIILKGQGFRDIYDESVLPQVTQESTFAMRWMHTLQGGNINLMDPNGNFLREMPISNLSVRTGWLAVGTNMEELTQGFIRTPTDSKDGIIDPDMHNSPVGAMQRVFDIFSNDNSKGRYEGMQPYVKYIEHCSGTTIKSWDDLAAFIDEQHIDILKRVYESWEDIDLMAGMWLEKSMKDAIVPQTWFCLFEDQLKRNVVSDRHWYERKDRPHAFTAKQLAEIRKYTISRMMCDIGDSVTKIQIRGFELPGKDNEIVDCANIPEFSFKPWRDAACYNGTVDEDEDENLFGKIRHLFG